MWDTMISSFASVARGYVQGHLEKAQAETSNAINAANAKNANAVRGATNRFTAAKGALARYMQSVNNNNRLDAGGEAMEANLVNARRREDAMQGTDFETQIRATEQMGAQAAAAAFTGVGGDVADMVSASTRLMQQRASHDASQARDYRVYDTARRQGVIASQTIRGMDNSLILDAMDYQHNVAQVQRSVNPWTRAILAGGDAWIDGKGFYDDANNRGGTTKESAQTNFRQSELRQEKTDSFNFSFGTGAEYGNNDYGDYI
jgi:hypothetical protein